MNEQLEQKSIELLGWLEQAIKTTTDFGTEQIPLFIQELLLYDYICWSMSKHFLRNNERRTKLFRLRCISQ